MPFKGEEPIQVRGGKPGTPRESWPAGWPWHPGRIKASKPELIPHVQVQGLWDWEPGSIEEMYQNSKVVQVRGWVQD